MTRLAALDRRLQELHVRTAETPLFNPVFQLGLELSRELESGGLTLGELESLVAELECHGLQSRAARLARLIGPVDPEVNDSSIARLAEEAGDDARLDLVEQVTQLLHECVVGGRIIGIERLERVARHAARLCFALHHHNVIHPARPQLHRHGKAGRACTWRPAQGRGAGPAAGWGGACLWSRAGRAP